MDLCGEHRGVVLLLPEVSTVKSLEVWPVTPGRGEPVDQRLFRMVILEKSITRGDIGQR